MQVWYLMELQGEALVGVNMQIVGDTKIYLRVESKHKQANHSFKTAVNLYKS